MKLHFKKLECDVTNRVAYMWLNTKRKTLSDWSTNSLRLVTDLESGGGG
jgi:hypothetical protein